MLLQEQRAVQAILKSASSFEVVKHLDNQVSFLVVFQVMILKEKLFDISIALQVWEPKHEEFDKLLRKKDRKFQPILQVCSLLESKPK